MLRIVMTQARRVPIIAWVGAVVAVLFALYIVFLGVMEAREEARMAAERQDDPARYLDELRTRRGIGAYIEALAEIRDFDEWREQAPTFLTGAWALVDAGRNVAGENPGVHCLSGLVIEDGRVRYFGERTGHVGAHYRIDGERIVVALADGGEIAMRPPPDPWHPHQLEITLPDSETPYYGFRCAVF
ncbi:MAG: hypothetical protein H6842_05295 [Rhodospirillaceae bacterium]|nr:hypothetical protein [Rhodospirillaceae bacterium]